MSEWFLPAAAAIIGIGIMLSLAVYLNPDMPEQDEGHEDDDLDFERPMDPVGAAILTTATRDAQAAVDMTAAVSALAAMAGNQPSGAGGAGGIAFAPTIINPVAPDPDDGLSLDSLPVG